MCDLVCEQLTWVCLWVRLAGVYYLNDANLGDLYKLMIAEGKEGTQLRVVVRDGSLEPLDISIVRKRI